MNNLRAHFKQMQQMATRYLEPNGLYIDREGRQRDSDQEDEDRGFIEDMIWMLDGPEQRAAEAELDQEREDLRTLVRSLMRDLRVVDHVVTLDEPAGKRTIVASKLMA